MPPFQNPYLLEQQAIDERADWVAHHCLSCGEPDSRERPAEEHGFRDLLHGVWICDACYQPPGADS